MLVFVAIILGVIEGLTEFLPVSSTGHLILAGEVLNFTGARASTFEVFIQLGAILAVVCLYRERFAQLVRPQHIPQHIIVNSITKTNSNNSVELPINDSRVQDSHAQNSGAARGLRGKRGLALLGLTTLPALIVGFVMHGFIKDHLFQPQTVAIGLAVGGVAIILFEYLQRHARPRVHLTTISLDTITPRQALGVGLFQLLALWPGVSRSASTIIGGMIQGLDRKTAVEYSFIIAVPVMIAATGYDLLKSLPELHASDIPLFAAGFLTAFISAVLAIKYFVQFVQRFGFTAFGWYRIGLAILVLIVLI